MTWMSNLAALGDLFREDLLPGVGVYWILDDPRLMSNSGLDIRFGIQPGTTENGFL